MNGLPGDAPLDEDLEKAETVLARVRSMHKAEGEILEALGPLDEDERKRVLAAVVILNGLVDPDVVLEVLGSEE